MFDLVPDELFYDQVDFMAWNAEEKEIADSFDYSRFTLSPGNYFINAELWVLPSGFVRITPKILLSRLLGRSIYIYYSPLYVFSSPEAKSQVSFSGQNLSFVRRYCHCFVKIKLLKIC